MFKSSESDRLRVCHNVNRKLASFFCFRRKSLYEESAHILRKIDQSFVELQEVVSERTGQVLQHAEELKVLGEKHDQLVQDHGEVRGRLDLVSSLLSARPAESSGLSVFRDILYGDFLDFANRESALAEEAKAILLMQEIERDLATVVAYPEIFMKNIVAIGGGFSSGKSALASSFFKYDEIKLPIGIEPVTAIPTYIVSSEADSITGVSSNGGTITVDADTYGKLSHDYVKSFGFNLRDIMPYMAVGTPMDQAVFEHLCLIDTPGYNPAESDGYTEEDKKTALKYLQNANALIWVIGLDSTGTIPKSDLDFLESMNLSGKHLFVVANKGDLKDQGELEDILGVIEETLDDYDIPYKGLSAYSAELKKEYYTIKQSFMDFLVEQNECVSSRDNLIKKLNVVFDMYITATTESLNQKESIQKEFKSLRLDMLEEGLQEIESDSLLHDRIEKIAGMVSGVNFSEFLKEIGRLKSLMVDAIDSVFKEICMTENSLSKKLTCNDVKRERLMLIDGWIRSRKHSSTEDMAKQLGISQNAISQNIKYLRECFFAPIEYDRKQKVFYYSDSEWYLPLAEAVTNV